jgi:hypothetical protein
MTKNAGKPLAIYITTQMLRSKMQGALPDEAHSGLH